MSKTDSLPNTVEWNQTNWRKVEKSVFKLQKRIYQASINGDVKKLRRLQKTLLNSHYAKLLSVRRVTQDNQGKKTAGIDGIKSLNPKERLSLVKNLKPKDKSKPVRRVWIPKSNGKKRCDPASPTGALGSAPRQRPLGIPVIRDRALQALIKAAIEPEWEAKFEPNSYGFRPGRCCQDAIEAIFTSIRYKPKFVLDADISKCFDRINHHKLLEKVNTFPKVRRQIKAWLKAGIADGGEFIFPTEGTPQGGICSPLLANIALHGMEEEIKEYAATWKGNKGANKKSLSLIRYADDFLIIHQDLKVVQKCKLIIKEWLSGYDLELNEEKTNIVNTLYEHNDNKPGVNFLGFNIRQYPVGKYQSGKLSNGKLLSFKTIIKPSKEKVHEHYRKLSEIIDSMKAAPQEVLIDRLSPIIRGWSNYYKTCSSARTYSKLSFLLFQKLRRWAFRRHPRKSRKWVVKKYWQTIGLSNWNFGCKKKDKLTLLFNHPETSVSRHIKVRGTASPYDGNTNYWASRMGKHPEMKISIAKLLKKQKGKCNSCSLTFKEGDIIQRDHIVPRKAGGHLYKDNLQLLHKHCHDKKTKEDLKTIKSYKIRKEWNKVYKKFQNQFDDSKWQWNNDLPTLV